MTSDVSTDEFDLETHKRERRKLIQDQIKKVAEEIKDHEYDIKQAQEQIKHLKKELEIYGDKSRSSGKRPRSWITVRRKRDRKGKWAYYWKVEKWFDDDGQPREDWFKKITKAEYEAFERKYKRK